MPLLPRAFRFPLWFREAAEKRARRRVPGRQSICCPPFTMIEAVPSHVQHAPIRREHAGWIFRFERGQPVQMLARASVPDIIAVVVSEALRVVLPTRGIGEG